MSQIRMFSTLDISASGLSAQRARMNVIAQNIANAGTTRTDSGDPYRRQEVLLEAVNPNGPAADGATGLPGLAGGGPGPANGIGTGPATGATPLVTDRQREAALGAAPAVPLAAPETVAGGVKVTGVQGDASDFPRVYDPTHPDADPEGYVKQPNVNMVNEMVDMMLAARAYEANLAVMTASKDLLMRTLSIGKQ